MFIFVQILYLCKCAIIIKYVLGVITLRQSQIDAVNKYAAKAYDRVSLFVKKGRKDIIKEHAARFDNGSVNAFINRAIDEQMRRDTEKAGE